MTDGSSWGCREQVCGSGGSPKETSPPPPSRGLGSCSPVTPEHRLDPVIVQEASRGRVFAFLGCIFGLMFICTFLLTRLRRRAGQGRPPGRNTHCRSAQPCSATCCSRSRLLWLCQGRLLRIPVRGSRSCSRLHPLQALGMVGVERWMRCRGGVSQAGCSPGIPRVVSMQCFFLQRHAGNCNSLLAFSSPLHPVGWG